MWYRPMVGNDHRAACCFYFFLPNPHGRPPVLRHYVQSSPHLFDRSSIAKQNLSHRANVICDGSPSRMRRVRRISFGMTTRPRSSMRRTMPVAFISKSPLSVKYYKAIVCRRREIMHELAFAQIASLRYNRNTKIFAKKRKGGEERWRLAVKLSGIFRDRRGSL